MSKDCERCFYFGKEADAPEGVDDDCMYFPGEDDDYEWTPPCQRNESEE